MQSSCITNLIYLLCKHHNCRDRHLYNFSPAAFC